MRVLKGFVTIQALLSNVPGTISAIGELSTWSATYTKERGEYTNPDIDGYRLISARSQDDTLGEVEVDQSLVNQTIEVVKAAFAYAVSHLRPYVSEDYKDTLLADFNGRVTNINFGPYVDNGTLALPEWLSWESLEHPDNFVKVWLSDAAFADQYDEYQMTVVPPLDNLDDFFLPPGTVKTLIEARSMTRMMELVQEAKENNPETYIRTYSFNYVSSVIGSTSIPTYWNVLIYGVAGDNVDAIKDALIDYVLANSTHTRTEWEAILPDLFKRTEFIVLPRWDLYSIPNMAIQAGLYSSMTDPVEAIEFAQREASFYTASHVQQNLTVIPYPYKAITVYIVNGITNVAGKEKITELFGDYIPVPSTSLDFNRMQDTTRQWSMLISEMLIVAEKMTAFTSVPKTMRKIQRSGKLYLAAMFDNVNYLMSAKSNFSA